MRIASDHVLTKPSIKFVNAHSANFAGAVQEQDTPRSPELGRRRLIGHERRHQLTDCSPNLRCQRKSPFGII
jgi:hypothetical protein